MRAEQELSRDALITLRPAPSRAGGRLHGVARFARANPLAAVAAIILLIFVFAAIFARLIAPSNPYLLNASDTLLSPTKVHLFGTDEFGRDVLSRVIYGARISLQVGALVVLAALLAGSVIGVVSGYFGGWTDSLVQRVVDMVMAFPPIVLALAIVAVAGQSVTNVVYALAIVQTPVMIRVVRAAVLSLKEQAFIEASQSVGASSLRIMFRHLLPNTAASIIVVASAGFSSAILAEASLSFLGLGTPAPKPSWGAMLSGSARLYAFQAPWLVVFPGVVLSLVVLSLNIFGDGLRDALDPRMRGTRLRGK
jgi:peptide/nickel transport system permease protein